MGSLDGDGETECMTDDLGTPSGRMGKDRTSEIARVSRPWTWSFSRRWATRWSVFVRMPRRGIRPSFFLICEDVKRERNT